MSDPAELVRRTPVSVAIAALKALRPTQWTKNSLLFAGLIFSGAFLEVGPIERSVVGFAAFSLLASSGYILNDYLDREADRRHPKKRHRPIASRALPESLALLWMLVVAGAGAALALSLSWQFLAVALLYLTTTLSYSFYFKHKVILDVMFIASGFVWRAVAGALAIDVKVSPWLFLCTAFFALFLGFEKRKGELKLVGTSGSTRKILAEYSEPMVEQFQSIATTSAVVSYALYCVLGPTPWMTATMPFVVYAIYRYIYLVDKHGEGAAPDETLLRDRPILATVVLYGLCAMAVLYGTRHGWLPAVTAS
jgi:4-hydroxybenzoate polyprenyltransferase